MKKIFLLLFLSVSLFANSQISYVEWDNKTEPISEQKRYYEDGSLKLENLVIEDTLYRWEYFENDSTKIIVQIAQYKRDTIWYIDAVTFEEKMKIVDYTIDKPNGVFYEFTEDGSLLKTGVLKGDIKQGIWYYHRIDGTLEKAILYDTKGHKKEVKEFYKDGNIKLFGKYTFKKTEIIEYRKNPINNKIQGVTIIKANDVKSGIWKYFLPNGKLDKMINYGKVK